MEAASRLRPAAILLADGLTSRAQPNGRVQLDHMIHQKICRVWFDYLPYSRNGFVETTDVFPYFFGLSPERNPARAGLERLLDEDLHPGCDHFITIRTTDARQLASVVARTSVHVRPSRYSADGRTWLVCSESAEARDRFLQFAHELAGFRSTHAVSPVSGWRSPLQREKASRVSLVGWCQGALAAAFEHCGVQFSKGHSRDAKLLSPSATRKERMSELRECVPKLQERGMIPLAYLKDPAWAARRGEDKGEAVVFVAHVLEFLVAEAEGQPVFLISDHNSEVGVDLTFAGPTSCAVFAENARALEHRHEPLALGRGPIPQPELVRWLDCASL